MRSAVAVATVPNASSSSRRPRDPGPIRRTRAPAETGFASAGSERTPRGALASRNTTKSPRSVPSAALNARPGVTANRSEVATCASAPGDASSTRCARASASSSNVCAVPTATMPCASSLSRKKTTPDASAAETPIRARPGRAIAGGSAAAAAASHAAAETAICEP